YLRGGSWGSNPPVPGLGAAGRARAGAVSNKGGEALEKAGSLASVAGEDAADLGVGLEAALTGSLVEESPNAIPLPVSMDWISPRHGAGERKGLARTGIERNAPARYTPVPARRESYDSDAIERRYLDRGEMIGAAAGFTLSLAAGAAALWAAWSVNVLQALLMGVSAGTAVGMLAVLGLGRLGWEVGFSKGRKVVDRHHLNWLARHKGRLESTPGVLKVRYRRGLAMASDAATDADGPLFLATLDGTLPWEQVRGELNSRVPEISRYKVFFRQARPKDLRWI
ncbi:MAG: hypothetical protein AAB339_12540, partial [Elusimicrobiota bacterium]